MTERVWLSLGDGLQVQVAYRDALTWGVDEFADLFRRSVKLVLPGEADEWASRQVMVRDAHLGQPPPDIPHRPVQDAEVVKEPSFPPPSLYSRDDDPDEDLSGVQERERPLVLQALCLWPHDKQAELCTFPDCACGVSGGIDIYSRDADWLLVERLWPNTLVFRRNASVLEVTVSEDVWGAFA